MPTDNKQSSSKNQNTQTVTPVMDDMPPVVMSDDQPPVVMEDTTPPMLNTTDLPIANSQTQTTPVVEEKKEETSETDSGSAAPNNDVVMAPVVTTQKKKFAGGRVIATILGLFLLVGGLGAGTYLVQQQQDIRERAGACADNPCGPGLQCDGSGGCIPKGSGDDYTGPVYEPPEEPWGGGDVDTNPGDGNSCDVQCGGPGLAFNFCLPAGSTKTCNQEALSRGYVVEVGSGCQPGQNCSVPAGYICRIGVNGYSGGPCTNDNKVPGTGSITSVPDCFCGTIQIDGGTNDGTYQMECGCGGNENTPPEPTPPSITAQCQNVKAYSSTWTLLTNAQLAQLKTGDSVNFCVAGSATGGSFNKARFTINGALQAETTTVRPSSTDFCQTYVIPAAIKTFNVSAQINHVTLGWK